MKPVIRKAIVNLKGKPFQYFAQHRDEWANRDDLYLFPGSIQYFGPTEVCDNGTQTLTLEHN